LALCASLIGCYERKDAAVINPDGSGKMSIEILVAVPAQGLPGKEKPTAVTFGRQVAANLINSTRGVDAWADLAITAGEGGRARIAATAYFPDLNLLKFDMPLVFVWKRDPASGGAGGAGGAGGGGATLAIERARTSVGKLSEQITEAELTDMVAKAQAQYKEQQLALQTQLNAFKLDMSFELPGDVTDAHVLARAGNSVALTLEGKKAMLALDQFMADEAALRATFKAGADLPGNDDIMLQSMYGQKGPVSAHVTFAADAKAVFDYRTEARVAQLRQADMLQAAGVELLPKFIVRPATQPASQPASVPATGGK